MVTIKARGECQEIALIHQKFPLPSLVQNVLCFSWIILLLVFFLDVVLYVFKRLRDDIW